MKKDYIIIKELLKNNKKISIIKSVDGKYFFKKLIIDNLIEEKISLKNEIKCLEILKSTEVVPRIVDYNLEIEEPYLITEYINLERLDKYNFSSLDEKLYCMINILKAVDIIHQHKIIHCDLKPQNIFIENNLEIKIIDFGISSINGNEIMTNYGSLNYCSPEKINKQKITVYSDMFSLAIIFYKLIMEELPFKKDHSNIKQQIEYYNIRKINDENLNKIFFKAINENHNYRYGSINEFKNDIIEYLDKGRKNMNEKYKKYLPLGSVVLMKDAKKRVMITGYAVKAPESGDKLWDYIGCLWPEGMIAPDKNLLFDHKDIKQIYAIGYSDDEQKRFMGVLDKATAVREERLNKENNISVENIESNL